MYQYFQNLLPSSFNTFFSKRSDIHDYHTRNRSNFNQTRNKKKFADKTIRTTGPTTRNSIDDKIKNAISTNHFRKSFKSLLIDINDVCGACLCLVWKLCLFFLETFPCIWYLGVIIYGPYWPIDYSSIFVLVFYDYVLFGFLYIFIFLVFFMIWK